MTMWPHSAPSNLIIQTHLHDHSLDEDSLSDLPELLEGETLESQEEYPQGVAEEAEEVGETQEYLPLQWWDRTPATN